MVGEYFDVLNEFLMCVIFPSPHKPPAAGQIETKLLSQERIVSRIREARIKLWAFSLKIQLSGVRCKRFRRIGGQAEPVFPLWRLKDFQDLKDLKKEENSGEMGDK